MTSIPRDPLRLLRLPSSTRSRIESGEQAPRLMRVCVRVVAQRSRDPSAAFKRIRCIVPASGYYEWPAAEGGKQPYIISAADGSLLSIAGLWDEWKDPQAGETIVSCTLIVTGANDFTRVIHDRMPVLLGQRDHEAWLTGKAGVELLRPAPNDILRMWPVSKRVNVSGRGDHDPSLIEPVEDEAIATS